MAASRVEHSARSILRSTSAFGGVQIFQILTALVRGKLVAIFLGPAGMGIVQLYMTAATTIQRLASLGLNLAIVKETGAAAADADRLRTTAATARWLLRATALLGALVCAALAPWLSRVTFGSADYTWGFAGLSLMVFFAIGGQGEQALLQGLRLAGPLMRSSVVGTLCGLCVSVPLYWLWGTSAIVPSLIILAGAVYAFNRHSVSRALDSSGVTAVWRSQRPLMRTMLATGLVLMASDAIGSGCRYLLNAYLRFQGGMEDVGLFAAADSLTMQYSGVVFAALAMDYLPRLSAVARSDSRLRLAVNRQAEIVAWLAAPLGAALILAAPLIVRVLLTESFEPVVPLLRLMGFSLTLKAVMFPMGYIAFAKDNRRVFFWLEGVWGNALFVLLGVAGFRLYGLVGLGYAQALDCLLSIAVYYIVNRQLYGLGYGRRALISAGIAIGTGALTLAASYIPDTVTSYTLMSVLTLGAAVAGALRLRTLWRR